jgi:hypothetical protein
MDVPIGFPAHARRHMPGTARRQCAPATMPRHRASEMSCASIKTDVLAGIARACTSHLVSCRIAQASPPHRQGIAQGSTGSSPSVTREDVTLLTSAISKHRQFARDNVVGIHVRQPTLLSDG